MEDELNPNLMFRLTYNELLAQIIKGEIDPVQLAKNELSNRGLDIDGNWIGYED